MIVIVPISMLRMLTTCFVHDERLVNESDGIGWLKIKYIVRKDSRLTELILRYASESQ